MSLIKERNYLVRVKVVCTSNVDNVIPLAWSNGTVNLCKADEQFHLVKSGHTLVIVV